MRYLAVADLHLGAGTDYGATPTSRLADQRRSWLAACQLAITHACQMVLFAGDAFHRPRPSPAELMAFRDGLDDLRAAEIPLIAITGNHDIASATPDAPHALSIFDGRGATVVSTPRVIHPPFGGVDIACLPWTPLGRFQAATDGDRDRMRQQAADALVHVAAGLRGRCTQPHTILLVHWSISGATTATGIDTTLFREVVLSQPGLVALGFDRIIAGHLHKPQTLSGDAGFYCGSIATVDFGEADVHHGGYLCTTDTVTGFMFKDIGDRPFLTLGLDDLDSDVTDAVVRVRYTASQDDIARTDHAKIKRRLMDAGAHHVYSISPTVERTDRSRVEGVAETTGPLEALNAWVDHQNVPKVHAARMRERTEHYLEGLA